MDSTLKILTGTTLAAGLAFGVEAATFTAGSTAPTSNVFVEHADIGSFTRLTDSAANPAGFTRGQTFTAPDTGDANTQWGLTAITFRMRVDNAGNGVPTSGSNPMRLQIFEWGPDTEVLDPGTEIYNMTGDFPLSVGAGDFISVDLGSTVNLDENSGYAFLLSWDTSSGNDIFIGIGNNAASTYDGGILWVENEDILNLRGQDLTFYLQGEAVPEPGSLALLGLSGLLTLRRRRNK